MVDEPGATEENPQRAKRTTQTFRLDLIQEILSADEETKTVRMSLRPDPRRYIPVDREGGTHFLDQYFNTIFRLEDFVNASNVGLPLYASGRTVSSAVEYATRRRLAIGSELETGEHVPPLEGARPHALLEVGAESDLAFLSVDICDSTARRRRNPVGYNRSLQIVFQEFGTTIGQFTGLVLKTTGDGLIAVIDGPSFTVKIDTTVDLGGTLLTILRDAINPVLAEAQFEPLAVRIGADYGPAVVREIAIPGTGFRNPDVVSDALNRAVKIQESCSPNTFRVGYDLYRLCHVQWLERCTAVEFNASTVGIDGYEAFEVN